MLSDRYRHMRLKAPPDRPCPRLPGEHVNTIIEALCTHTYFPKQYVWIPRLLFFLVHWMDGSVLAALAVRICLLRYSNDVDTCI
jgi:hypothetical protein